MPTFRSPLLALLLALAVCLVAGPAASGSPTFGHATAAKKVKPCKKRRGETGKHWLKRCKCGKFKRGETRAKFKKRCPGAKVPRRGPAGGGGNQSPAPQTTPPSTAPPANTPAQSDVDKVTQALTGTQLQYFTYSQVSGASDDERYKFCAGTFEYTRNRIGLTGAAYDSYGSGSWRITQATVNPDGISGTATLHYVLASYQSNDPDGTPPTEADVPFSFYGSKVEIGGRTYDATKVAC